MNQSVRGRAASSSVAPEARQRAVDAIHRIGMGIASIRSLSMDCIPT
jgi:hypothetical protein